MSLANRFKNLYQGQLFNFWTSTAFLPLKISFIGMLRDAFRNKNGIMWEKFPRGQAPPPPPPVWERPCHKKILRFISCFRTLGAFLVFTKMLTFCDKVMWEWGNPPSATPVFAISPQKKTYLRVQIDQISISHFCKTFFSTSGWMILACKKKLGKQTYTSGNGSDPPPKYGKNSHLIPFFSEDVPNQL